MSQLTKAQVELLEASKDSTHYLELIASGVIAGPVDPNARCFLKLEDSLRLVRVQGLQIGALADACSDPSDEARRISQIAFSLMD